MRLIELLHRLLQLFQKGLIEGLRAGISGDGAVGIDAEDAVEHLQGVEGHIGKVGFAGNLDFPAAVVGEASRLAFRITFVFQRPQNQILVIHRDDAAAVPHHLGGFAQQPFGGTAVQPHGDGEIGNGQLLHDIQHQVSDVVGHLPAGGVDPGQNNVLIMLGVPRTRPGLGLDPLAAFDEKGGENFPGFGFGQDAGGQILLQVVAQQPVDPSDARPVAAQADKGENEPERLHRFEKIPRRGKRHPLQRPIDRRLFLPDRVQIAGVPDAEGFDDVVQAAQKGGLLPVGGQGETRGDIPLIRFQALFQHPVVTDG